MKRLEDMRAYIAALQEIGELQSIDKEVDWNLEIGAIIRHSYDLRAPAPLFNTIAGYEPGFRVLGAPGGVSSQPGLELSRIALALGLDVHARGPEIVEALAEMNAKKPIPAREVATAPCKENRLIGDDVDLLRIPTPLIHAGDGGRYIDTYGITVVQTPDKRWTNWSITRKMVVDKNRMTGLVVPNQHWGLIDAEWKKLGKPTPFALVLGVEPFIPFVGGMPLPAEVDESGFVGAYFGEATEVVRCETIDLLVPASAEIVIEGFISRTETAMEGPMGEFAGYEAHQGTLKPVFNITAMTYRNGAILPVVTAGVPIEEDHTVMGIPHAAQVLYDLRTHNVPVTMCWMMLEAACHLLIVTVPQNWREQADMTGIQLCEKIGTIVFDSKAGFGIPKIILLEDDVDATNINEVIWAFATRSHPGREVLFNDEPTNIIPIFLDSKEKLSYKGTKLVYNCLSHDDWTPETKPLLTSFKDLWPTELQKRVLDNWEAYGYKG